MGFHHPMQMQMQMRMQGHPGFPPGFHYHPGMFHMGQVGDCALSMRAYSPVSMTSRAHTAC